MKSDEDLMREYQAGSEAAFEALYEKYSSMVFSFIKRRLRETEVEDFYQKVWRHLHEKRTLFKDQPFAPWFFVLIRNLLTDEYRSQARRKSREFSDELIEKIYHQESSETDMEELFRQLPEASRELVSRYYLEGISYEELEIETGLSQVNLRQRLSRALRGLRKLYEEE